MDRRSFVRASAASFAFGPGLFDGGRAGARGAQADGSGQGPQPNILVVKVDELRFPSVFPSGINGADEFLAKYMPNLYQLWRHGVKFQGHYTAANACTPARGTIITGLYSQQSWLVQTILAKPESQHSIQPWLNPVFPTYGKLLRRVGYQTPYVGKWHVSIPRQDTPRLSEHGFDGLTWPDPTGANLQGAVGDHGNPNGTGQYPYLSDADIASQGAQWLQQYGAAGVSPWCLTVSFINPHDKEFFPAGTEFQTYNQLFEGQATYQPFSYYSYSGNPAIPDSPPLVTWDADNLKAPPSYGYPSLPPNWESAAQLAANKPATQSFVRTFQEAVWGGVSEDPAQQGFTIDPYPPTASTDPPQAICKTYGQAPNQVTELLGIGKAPYSYWQRSLDCYTLTMTLVDGAIGTVLNAFGALPASVQQNTVIVFMSDHGEYAGAHGLVSGKVGSFYDVRSSQAADRDYVLLATDESSLGHYNFNAAPLHIVGLRTQALKFGLYANWAGPTAQIADDGKLETEFYDYSTAPGRAELDNISGSNPNDPRIPALEQSLLGNLIPNVLCAPLPGLYGEAQTASQVAYLAYDTLIRNIPPQKCTASGSGSGSGSGTDELSSLLAFGQDF